MSDISGIDGNEFKQRRYLLESAQPYLSDNIYKVLLNLLNSRTYNQFDVLFNSSTPTHLRDVFNISSTITNEPLLHYQDSDLHSKKIKKLEMQLSEHRDICEQLHKHIAKLEIDLGSALDSKEKTSTLLRNQTNKNRELSEQNQELQSKIQQKKIDEKVPEYVQGVKEKLQQDDKDFTAMSYKWAISGVVFCVLAIISAFLTFFFKIDIKDTTLTELLYYYTRGLLGVALLSWLSYFCLNNSKKYTHEAIIRKDRQHALMFGEVFLQIYGSTATKQDAIDVFKDWNMSANSAFSDKTQQPPNLFNILGSVLNKKTAANDDK